MSWFFFFFIRKTTASPPPVLSPCIVYLFLLLYGLTSLFLSKANLPRGFLIPSPFINWGARFQKFFFCIISLSLSTGSFWLALRLAVVSPLLKKRKKKTLKNPVSLSPVPLQSLFHFRAPLHRENLLEKVERSGVSSSSLPRSLSSSPGHSNCHHDHRRPLCCWISCSVWFFKKCMASSDFI